MTDLKAQRVFVTGGTGFLGSHLIERLLEEGARVRTLVRSAPPSWLRSTGVECVSGDLLEPDTLLGAVDGADVVIHCAALATDFAPRERFMRVNVDGTRAVVEACIRRGVGHLVHVSTTDVYGYPDGPCTEASEPRTTGLGYADSKAAAEKVVRKAGREGRLAYSIVRPENIYGPRSISFVLDIAHELARRSMLLVDGGRRDAGLAYVGNVVDVIAAVANSEAARGRIYNVSDGEKVTWREYVEALSKAVAGNTRTTSLPYAVAYGLAVAAEGAARLTGSRRPPKLTRMAVKLLGRPGGHATDRARTELGVSPRVRFPEGIELTKQWLRTVL